MESKEAKIFDAVTPYGNPTTGTALEAHRATIRRERGIAQLQWMIATDNGHRLPVTTTQRFGEKILLLNRKRSAFGRRKP